MKGAEWLTLGCGVICTVYGAVLILLRNSVEGAVWFGTPVTAGGLALIGLALLSTRRSTSDADTAVPVTGAKRPGLWFPMGLLVMVVLQVIYLLWWAHFAGR